MPYLASILLKLREKKGHKSARSLYNNFTSSENRPFNYSYYMKIEKGDVLPSPKIIEFIASFFDPEDSDLIHLAYCKDMFPDKRYLFESPDTMEIIHEKNEIIQNKNVSKSELNIKQVAALASKKEVYEIFIIASLARRKIKFQELTDLYDEKKIKSVIKKLTSLGLIESDNNTFKTRNMDYIFPKDYNEDLKKMYKTFDKWDLELPQKLNLEKIIHKSFTKRVSLRYLNLMQDQLNFVFELIRSADDNDPRHNEQVIQLVVSLNSGKLPG